MSRPLTPLSIATSLGTFVACYSEKGLAELNFPRNGKAGPNEALAKSEIPTKVRAWHQATEAALTKLISGKQPGRLPPLDLNGTDFQKSVWGEMLKIPFGKTKSYGDIAKAIGKPKAMRAVGSACGANNIPVLVPCHRVLAAHNKIGGFSSGLGWKSRLLEIEGISIGNETRWG